MQASYFLGRNIMSTELPIRCCYFICYISPKDVAVVVNGEDMAEK